MSSRSDETTETTTQNLAVDRRAVLESGTQIVDSIYQSNEPAVIAELAEASIAQFEQMAASERLNLLEISSIAQDILQLADKSQLNISEHAYKMLEEGQRGFEDLIEQNAVTVELVDGIADRSFETVDRALDLVATVKTDGRNNMMPMMMLFALFAMLILSGRNN